jgi:hypothetical protein
MTTHPDPGLRTPDPETWGRRAAALRLILADFALLHGLVMDEIGHPLPPDLRDFVRDWLDAARVAVEKAGGAQR